ncbi:MAG: triphosphoribosyl-dephospho-CoA synthase, partial [Planctomycetales bacterium]
LACLMEVTAPKPGNVHRGADFDDVGFFDFAASAVAVTPAMEDAVRVPVGETVLRAALATREMVQSNTNLGTLLLLAPLAKVPRTQPLDQGVQEVLAQLTPRDAELVYEAVRVASPGGLGKVEEADVSGPAPQDLLQGMRLAADRDLVAQQYVNGFHHVLGPVRTWLLEIADQEKPLQEAVLYAFLRLLSEEPDSLIARKSGEDVARQASARAARVLEAGPPCGEEYHREAAALDFWLRGAGRLRNPGTTADLIAAALFGVLRDGRLRPPFHFHPRC